MAECFCGTLATDSWLESLKGTQILSSPSSLAETEKSLPPVCDPLVNWTASNVILNKSHQISCFWQQQSFIFFLGSMDNTVHLWDAIKAFDDLETDDFTAATGHIHLQDNSQELLLGTYMSKSTPVIHLHFTRRNLLLAAGAYNPWHITGQNLENSNEKLLVLKIYK